MPSRRAPSTPGPFSGTGRDTGSPTRAAPTTSIWTSRPPTAKAWVAPSSSPWPPRASATTTATSPSPASSTATSSASGSPRRPPHPAPRRRSPPRLRPRPTNHRRGRTRPDALTRLRPVAIDARRQGTCAAHETWRARSITDTVRVVNRRRPRLGSGRRGGGAREAGRRRRSRGGARRASHERWHQPATHPLWGMGAERVALRRALRRQASLAGAAPTSSTPEPAPVRELKQAEISR